MKKLAKIFLTMLILALAALVIVACDSKPSEFTVTFVYPDGEVVSTQTVEKGYAATAPEVKNTIDGVPFLAWDKDFSKITADTTVTAIYEFPTYKVSFDTKGGTSVEDQKIRYGQLPTKPADPEKPGYTFSKWYEDPDFTIECKFDKAYDTNTTIYARFINDYTWISSVADLDAIRVNPTAKYILANDIDLGGAAWTPIETFSGILDGNGHKICNFTLSSNSEKMGFVNDNKGVIENIIFDNFNATYNYICKGTRYAYAAVIAGKNVGTIRKCSIRTGNIQMNANMTSKNALSSTYMGAIVGWNYGTIFDCKNYVDISSKTICTNTGAYNTTNELRTVLGSAVGKNFGYIHRVYASGTIVSENEISSSGTSNRYTINHVYVGGLLGLNEDSVAKTLECTSDVNINITCTGTAAGQSLYAGLLVGTNKIDATIKDSSATGNLNVQNNNEKSIDVDIGGIGLNLGGTINNVQIDGIIDVKKSIHAIVGGLIGLNRENGVIKNSVYIGNINIGANVTDYGIVIGKQNSSLHGCYYGSVSFITKDDEHIDGTCTVGEAKELAELQSAEFIYETLGWDSEIWQINEGSTPTLKCFAE